MMISTQSATWIAKTLRYSSPAVMVLNTYHYYYIYIHLFYVKKKDCRVKVWDMRALGIHDRPVGYLLGHVCGITSVASREDGYYVASNSKYVSFQFISIFILAETSLSSCGTFVK
jgi:hypothetical protein